MNKQDLPPQKQDEGKLFAVREFLEYLAKQLRFDRWGKQETFKFKTESKGIYIGGSKAMEFYPYLNPKEPMSLNPELFALIESWIIKKKFVVEFKSIWNKIDDTGEYFVPPEERRRRAEDFITWHNNTLEMIKIFKASGIPTLGSDKVYNDNLSVKVLTKKGTVEVYYTNPRFSQALSEALGNI